jgi:hypothetical protein
VDVVVESSEALLAVEAKSGRTVPSDALVGIEGFVHAIEGATPLRSVVAFLVHAGEQLQRRSGTTILPWSRLDETEWWGSDELPG